MGDNGGFPHDIDVIVIGTPDRDGVTDAIVDALRAIGHDGQVIFRSPSAWREAKDAFTRTAKAGPLVKLDLETFRRSRHPARPSPPAPTSAKASTARH